MESILSVPYCSHASVPLAAWLSISAEPHNFFCIVFLCTAIASSAQPHHGIGFELIRPNAAIAHQLVADLAHPNGMVLLVELQSELAV